MIPIMNYGQSSIDFDCFVTLRAYIYSWFGAALDTAYAP